MCVLYVDETFFFSFFLFSHHFLLYLLNFSNSEEDALDMNQDQLGLPPKHHTQRVLSPFRERSSSSWSTTLTGRRTQEGTLTRKIQILPRQVKASATGTTYCFNKVETPYTGGWVGAGGCANLTSKQMYIVQKLKMLFANNETSKKSKLASEGSKTHMV